MTRSAQYQRIANVIDNFVDSLTKPGHQSPSDIHDYAFDDEVMHSGHGDAFLNEMSDQCGRALSKGEGRKYTEAGLNELREIARRIRAAAAELEGSSQ